MAENNSNIPFVHGLATLLDGIGFVLESSENLQELLRELGWQSSIDENTISGLDTALAFSAPFQQIRQLIVQLEQEDSDKVAIVDNIIQASRNVFEIIENVSSAPLSGLGYPFDQPEFAQQLHDELFPKFLDRYLQHHLPKLHGIIYILGIIDAEEIFPDEEGRLAYIKYSIHLDRMFKAISDPSELFSEVYGWKEGKFKYKRFLEALELLFGYTGIFANQIFPDESIHQLYYDENNHPSRAIKSLEIPFLLGGNSDWSVVFQSGLIVLPIPEKGNGSSAEPVGFSLIPMVRGSLTPDMNDEDSYVSMDISGSFATDGAFRVDIRPDEVEATLDPEIVEFQGGVNINVNPPEPWIIIGDPERSHFEASGLSTSFETKGTLGDPEFIVGFNHPHKSGLQEPNLALVINFGEGDGFVQKIFGTKPQKFEFGFGLQWSSKHGILFNGQLGFEIKIPAHINIGPLSINNLYFELKADTASSKAYASVGAGVGAKLGPLSLMIENTGLKLDLIESKSDNQNGLFGDLDLDFGFKPPNQVGIQIDTSAVKGGGFLGIDPDKGEYTGVVELTVKEAIALKAIGIINTKLPNGEEGYSLLLLITAEFSPLQLGFGFTLNGVGGLIGINRSMNLLAIRIGIKNDTIDHILFPDDPVANAPQIIANLNSVFPIADENHSFGFMGIIAWGVPTLLEVELGLMISFPSYNIAVIGKLSTSLPNKRSPLLVLNVAFAGTLSLANKYLYFDAQIENTSRLLSFSLSGSMAVRILWGDEPNFVLSVGGFHPDFVPPPLELGNLERITLNLLADDNPRLILKCYFAVTSNTVQFGATIDFFFKKSKFSVVGFFYFHALFQLNPFYFIIALGARLDVKLGSRCILTVGVEGNLEGTTPWKAAGKGRFKVWRVPYSVSFSKTWGERNDTSLPNIAIYPELQKALLDDRSWSALLPGLSTLTTLRKAEGETDPQDEQQDALIIHPFGSLSVLQRVVPLDINIDKFGSQAPGDFKKFRISYEIGGVDVDTKPIKDFFAPAQFFNLSDDQKISRKSYEKQNAGVSDNSENLQANFKREKSVEYELRVIDSIEETVVRGVSYEPTSQLNHWAKGSTIANSSFGKQAELESFVSGRKIKYKEEEFVIVHQDSLFPLPDLEHGSEFQIQNMLNELLEENPEMEDKFMVVPAYEIL